MATTEIEKLERRYAENPQGLTFAPLAEVHRKNGEVTRALELLRAGLELHPNYIPASIVLGRCHWDLGDLPAAEAAFSHVLRLDDENVIALKSLADISERLERYTEAQRWLNRLISVDRSNEEARQQLARIESARQQAPAPPVAEVKPRAPAPAPAEARPSAVTPAPAEIKPPLDLTAAIAEPKSSELQFLDTSGPSRQISQPETPQPKTPQEAGNPPEEPAPLAGLISQEFVPPKDGVYRLHPELTHDYGSPEHAEAEDLEVETAEEVELQSSGASEFRVPNAAEDFMEAAATTTVNRPSDIETAPPPVYEPPAPVEAPPALERPRTQEPPPSPSESTPPPERPRRSYSVRETHGQSVGAFFQSLLAARPPGTVGGPSTDARPAARSQEPTAAPTGTPQDAAVSFDDFFGTPSPDQTPAAKKEGDSSKDDLDQFQTWLQNLKR
jgi:Tetratricopeptide repeat